MFDLKLEKNTYFHALFNPLTFASKLPEGIRQTGWKNKIYSGAPKYH
jgi:hypothetical protein